MKCLRANIPWGNWIRTEKKLKTEVDWNMDCWIISIECWRRSECIENDWNNVGFSGGSHAWMRLWQVARFAWKNWFFGRSKKEQAMGFGWNDRNEMWTNLYGKTTADLILLRRRTIKQLERNHQDIKISPIITFWGNRYSININLRHWNFLCIVGKSSNFVLKSLSQVRLIGERVRLIVYKRLPCSGNYWRKFNWRNVQQNLWQTIIRLHALKEAVSARVRTFSEFTPAAYMHLRNRSHFCWTRNFGNRNTCHSLYDDDEQTAAISEMHSIQ